MFENDARILKSNGIIIVIIFVRNEEIVIMEQFTKVNAQIPNAHSTDRNQLIDLVEHQRYMTIEAEWNPVLSRRFAVYNVVFLLIPEGKLSPNDALHRRQDGIVYLSLNNEKKWILRM
jgi:hypothetical protein